MNDGYRLIILPVFDRVEEALQRQAIREQGYARTDRHLTLARLVDVLCWEGLRQTTSDQWWHRHRPATAVQLAVLRRQLVVDLRNRAGSGSNLLLNAPSASRLLAGFFEECSEGLVSAQEFDSYAAEMAPGNDRIQLLSELYRLYRVRLSRSRLLDGSDRIRLARDLLARDDRGLPRLLQGIHQVEVRDQFDWSALRLSLVMQLAIRLHQELGPPERLRLVIPYSHQGHRLFHHMERTLREIEKRSELPIEVIFSAIEEETEGPTGRVAAALFRDGPQVAGGQQAVHLASAPGRDQELRGVARRIRRLLDACTSPDDIVVGLRHVRSDWLALARALDRYDIPWHYRRGDTLSETPLFRYLTDLLAAVHDGLPREAFERLITSVFCEPPRREVSSMSIGGRPEGDEELETRPSWDDEGEDDGSHGVERNRPVTRSFEDRVLSILGSSGVRDLDTGAIRGRNGYEVRLSAYLARLSAKAARVGSPSDRRANGRATSSDRLDTNPSTEDSSQAPELAAFHGVAADIEHILQRVRLLDECRASRTLAQWVHTLCRLVETPLLSGRVAGRLHRLHDPSLDHPDRLDTAAVRMAALNQRSWVALWQVLGDLEAAPRSSNMTLTARELRTLLLEIGSEISLNPVGSRGAAVRIVPVRQLVGARYRHVFLPHVNEKRFPASTQTDPLFRDPERVAFNRWRRERARGETVFTAFRIDQPQPDDERVPVRRSEEVALFCLALASATERAYISWSTRDMQDRPLLPSLFVDGLRRVLADDETGVPLTEFEPIEVLPSLTRLESIPELAWLALANSSIEPSSEGNRSWFALADQALGRARSSSIARRTRVERARHHFFESLLEDHRLRREPPPDLPRELAPYLGYVTIAPVVSWVSHRRFRFDRSSPASPTRLERYGQCPARFFFYDVLRVRPEEEALEEMHVSSRGRLLHLALERFYRDLTQAGFDSIAAIQGESRPQILKLIRRSVEKAASQLTQELHLGHPRLLAIDRRRIGATLVNAFDRIVSPRYRSARLPLGHPSYQEWQFGGGDGPQVALDLGPPLGSIFFSGRIDRIDVGDEGDLLVTDYKLGGQSGQKKKLGDDRLHRRDFQLSIYAMAAVMGLTLQRLTSVEVQYFCFDDGKSAGLGGADLVLRLGDILTPFLAGNREDLPAVEIPPEATKLAEGLAEVVGGIHQCRFCAATRGCDYCEFGTLCRVSDLVEREVES